MDNAPSGICFWINLLLSPPQRWFDFWTGWIFDLIGIDGPDFLGFVGGIFGCTF